MKKILVFLLILVTGAFFSADAFAKNGISADFGLGIKSDCNQLNGTIMKDGLTPTTTINGADAENNVIIAENTLIDGKKKGAFYSVNTNGGMTALDIALHGRIDMLGWLFVRLGWNYNFRIMGGETSYKFKDQGSGLGFPVLADDNGDGSINAEDYSAPAPELDALLGGTNYVPSVHNIAGKKVSYTWNYTSWAIPLTFGINIPIADGKYNIYAGFGITYANGGFSLTIKAPAYTILTSARIVVPEDTWVTGVDDSGDAITAPSEDTGIPTSRLTKSIKEPASIYMSGIGLNTLIGVDATVAENISVFIEWEVTYIGDQATFKLKTTGGKDTIGSNSLTYPAIPGGTIFRFGAKYFIGDFLGI